MSCTSHEMLRMRDRSQKADVSASIGIFWRCWSSFKYIILAGRQRTSHYSTNEFRLSLIFWKDEHRASLFTCDFSSSSWKCGCWERIARSYHASERMRKSSTEHGTKRPGKQDTIAAPHFSGTCQHEPETKSMPENNNGFQIFTKLMNIFGHFLHGNRLVKHERSPHS